RPPLAALSPSPRRGCAKGSLGEVRQSDAPPDFLAPVTVRVPPHQGTEPASLGNAVRPSPGRGVRLSERAPTHPYHRRPGERKELRGAATVTPARHSGLRS